MKRNLPNIYHVPIKNPIKNNEKVYFSSLSKNKEVKEEPTPLLNVKEEIDRLFQSEGHIFNQEVTITTKEKKYQTSLVSKTKQGILTIDNDFIRYDDILSFQKKSH